MNYKSEIHAVLKHYYKYYTQHYKGNLKFIPFVLDNLMLDEQKGNFNDYSISDLRATIKVLIGIVLSIYNRTQYNERNVE